MAEGQYLSPYQKGLVKRYYKHKETLATQKLGELVSELWFARTAPDEARAKRLWQSARAALLNAGVNPARVEKLVGERDLSGLAELLSELV